MTLYRSGHLTLTARPSFPQALKVPQVRDFTKRFGETRSSCASSSAFCFMRRQLRMERLLHFVAGVRGYRALMLDELERA